MLLGFEDLDSMVPQEKPNAVATEEGAFSDVADSPSADFLASHGPVPRAGDLVVLIDSHSLIYQVFHALPSMTSPQGQEVGAVQGFLRDIANLLQQWKPQFLVCTFDASETTFRNEIYEPYKAHRDPMPDALRDQLGLIHNCLDVLSIPKISMAGYEADDLMATLAKQAAEHGAKVLLVTSDKDCRQLISDHVQMLNVRKGELFGEEELKATWGIRPDQVVDFQSLVGDSVDNVPGVPMIGPKAAQLLLEQFDTLDGLYENVEMVAGEKKKESLKANREQAFLSRQLVKLKEDCPIEMSWIEMRPGAFDREQATHMFRDLGLRKLSELYMSLLGDLPETGEKNSQLPREGYRTIHSLPELVQLAEYVREAKTLAIDTETTSTRPRDAELVGISICWATGQSAYIPIRAPSAEPKLALEDVQRVLGPLLTDSSKQFIGQNLKFDLTVLENHGIPLSNILFDTMVADYLLDAGGRNHDLEELAKRWLGHKSIPISALIGTGKDQRSMADVPLTEISTYACEDVDIPFRLLNRMRERLVEEQLTDVLDRLELPLIRVLSAMESEGIRISESRLHELGEQFQSRMNRLYGEILELAGESFNPDSPKQLATILFEKLGLRVIKKTKTGASTDAEVLEELASEHPLPAKIVEYRQFTKLKSTYIDALPRLISPKTGRVHTSFRQDIAATGRLSSAEPNLQNIPVRTAEGRSIRSAFLSRADDWSLVAADYSQIELRVLAHYSKDESLCRAFQENQDIHTIVAAEVNGVAVTDVTAEMRRNAKAVNFGIIYGQSPFGLSKGLGISRTEASDFIDRYFAKYPSVREFIGETLVQCRHDGFVRTMAGRKRFLRGLRDYPSLPDAKKKQLLEPERMAVNTVIQGSAADMIKLAMIEIHRQLQSLNWPVQMLLQIHDELIFDCRDDHRDRLAHLLRETMTSVMPLRVPLQVEIKQGRNWAECEVMS